MVTEEHPADISRFQAGHVLAGYRLETKIGEGGMAVVYRARDERLRRLVALKILAPEFAADTAFRRRFIGESEAAAAVDHPHIIPVYDHGEADGVLYISMRYVAGGDLRQLMQREGALSPSRVAEIVSPVASALDAAHRTGLVHRDVKPGNILVDTGPGRPDHAMLSDFGVSKSVTTSANLTGTGQFIGTAGYSAPEQIQEFDIDGRADEYALACVTYEMLTGEPLFHRITIYGTLIAHVHDEPPTLTSRRPDLPPAADLVMAKALAKTPDERYATCADFADALRDAFGLPPYHASGALADPDQGQPPPQPPTVIVPGSAVAEQPARTWFYAGEPESELLAVAEETTLDQHEPTVVQAVPSALSAGTTEVIETLTPESVAEGLEVKGPQAPEVPREPGEPEEGTEPAADEAAPGASETAPSGLLADTPVPLAAVVPPTVGSAGRVPAPRDWRRLPLVAVAAVIIGVGVTVPFVLRSPSGTVRPQESRRPSPSASSPVTISPPTRLALPSAFGKGAVSSVAVSPTGTIVAIADAFGGICMWDVAAKDCAMIDPGVWAVAYSHDGTTLAGSDEFSRSSPIGNGVVRLWNAATGKQIGSAFTDPYSAGALSVAFSPNDATLAVGDQNGNTYLWNVATRTSIVVADPSGQGVNAVAFSPDGALLAVADASGHTSLFNADTLQLIRTYTDEGSVRGAFSLAFSPDGRTLAIGDGNGHIYLWNVTAKAETKIDELTDPNSGGVRAVAFSPNGQMLATGDNNGTTYLWNLPSGKRIAALGAPQGSGVTTVAFDGTTLVTGYENGTVDTWSID